MDYLLHALKQALELMLSGETDLWSAVGVSLKVSLSATILAGILGLPLGFLLATFRFPGRGFLINFSQALMAMPTVVIGLLLYSALFRQGPLGTMELLFTPTAMMIAEVLLILPLIVSLAYGW